MSALFNLFYIYDPWFFHVLRMAFLCGVLAVVYLAIQLWRNKKLNLRLPLDSLVAIIGLIVISVLPLLINGMREVNVLFMYIKMLIIFLFGVGIYHLFYRCENGQTQLMRDLQIGIGVQFVFGVLALLGVTPIIDFLLNTNVVMPRFYGSEQEYRLYNITSSAFFQLSLFYLFLLHFWLAYNHKYNNLPSTIVFLMLCVGLISGRTFLTISMISLVLYFKVRYIPSLLSFLALILVFAICFPENPYVAHALEPIINLINGAEHLSSSTDTLIKNHLFIPSLKQFMIGDGYYFTPEHHYYGGTDSGFLRQILYGGVIYMLSCFAFTFYFVWRVAVNWFNGSWKFILSTMLIFTICNVKADTFAFPGIMMTLLMFLSLFGEKGKNLILFKGQSHV